MRRRPLFTRWRLLGLSEESGGEKLKLRIEKIVRLEPVDTAYIIRNGDDHSIVGLMNDVELSAFIREVQRVKNLPINKD